VTRKLEKKTILRKNNNNKFFQPAKFSQKQKRQHCIVASFFVAKENLVKKSV
jgi:hypothetical protein